MALGTDGQHRPHHLKLQDFHVDARLRQDVGDCHQLLSQQLHGGHVIGASCQLAFQRHSAEGVVSKVLDSVTKYRAVADNGQDVFGRLMVVVNRPISWAVPVIPPTVT